MKKLIKIIIGVFATIGVAYVALLIVVTSGVWPDRTCTIYPILKLPSPSGRFIAEHKQQICTPENNLETTVWLEDKDTNTNWGVFSAQSIIAKNQRANSASGVTLNLSWKTDNLLKITYPIGTKVTQKMPPAEINGVKVIYEEDNR